MIITPDLIKQIPMILLKQKLASMFIRKRCSCGVKLDPVTFRYNGEQLDSKGKFLFHLWTHMDPSCGSTITHKRDLCKWLK